MMRIVILLIFCAFVMPAQAAGFWAGLWRNADQQGEALMQKGEASSAAQVYADPRRKAYAKLKAGDYQGAAEQLDTLHESDDDYNRGNALAHAGKLQDALQAYDAALKSNPDNQDARHNRELVARALKQQAPQQQKSDEEKSQDENKDGKQNDPDKPENQGKQDDKTGKDGKGQDSSAKNEQQQKGNEGRQSQEGQKSPADKNPGEKNQNDKSAGQEKNGNKEQPSSAKNNAPASPSTAKDDAEQARHDAEASLAKPATTEKSAAEAGDRQEAGNTLSAGMPRSEQQIAQEQWLRSIPDDPGGLLRRKFMIQHMMRKQKAQQ